MTTTTLFVVSKTSEMLLERIVTHSGNKVVVAEKRIAPLFEDIGINAIAVEFPAFTVQDRDAAFAVDGLPGVLEGVDLVDGLPAWKILGIDRLRFWYNPRYKFVRETIELVDFAELVVSFDITSILPWLAVEVARLKGVRSVAIKVDSLARREVVDFLDSSPVDEIVVATVKERNMLLKMTEKGMRTKVTSINIPAWEQVEVEGLRDKTAVLFESAHDWKFLKMINKFVEMGDVVVCVRDMREWQNFLSTFPGSDKQFEMREIASLFSYARVLLPAFYEDVVQRIPANAQLGYYDLAKTDRAVEFDEAMR